MTLLALHDLGVRLGPPRRGPRAAGVSLSVARGERIGLIGASGCGRSMTAPAVMGLLLEGARVAGSLRFAG